VVVLTILQRSDDQENKSGHVPGSSKTFTPAFEAVFQRQQQWRPSHSSACSFNPRLQPIKVAHLLAIKLINLSLCFAN
jgi:hypothetical protein